MFDVMIVDFMAMQPIEQGIIVILISTVIAFPIGILMTQGGEW